MGITFKAAGKTDIGLVRTGNEDNLKILEDQNLFVVCDGMGGHQAGEVASGMACDIISYCFTGMADRVSSDSRLKLPEALPAMSDLLLKSIRLSSRAIFNRAEDNPEQQGMGTTTVAALFEGNMVAIAHVGDSRAYKLVGRELIPLTEDHSWVNELKRTGMYDEMKAAGQVNKNVITRALGVHDVVEADYSLRKVHAGDIYILCSDGLCGFAEDEIISEVAQSCDGNVAKIVDSLIKVANDRGGQDNVTVIAVRVDEVEGEYQHKEIDPLTIAAEDEDILKREDEICAEIGNLLEKAVTASEPEEKSSGSNMPMIIIGVIIVIIIALVVLSFLK